MGTKVLIAVTGLLLFAYLILHLAGNLLILFGADLFNEYAHMLISNPLVIPAEIGLLLIALVHVYKTVKMYLQNQHARPDGYAVKKWAGHTSRKSVGSATMIVSGLVTAVFVGVHLKQFKYGAWYEVTGTAVRDLYRTEVEVFQNPLWVVVYVLCMGLIYLHLRHGIASAFQSLGASENFGKRMLRVGLVVAIVIGGGFAIIPLFVYFAK
ncbi:MAG TPA: succinate dehydrogenase cytochrome b subunit [Vicinamibacterales bacterium]|nr:succinate dehydrogenase cytochrome b subunit [Vicinamibacterales bacterium]